jgi:DNA-binding NtrC family response regulator
VSKTVRILIVEDDENVAAGIRMALTLRGYEVESCATAEDALARLQEGCWALVISDLRLPGCDGQKLLQQLAQTHPQTRRILITGFGTPETELWASSQADDYLVKPFSTDRLVESVQRLLASAAGAQDLHIKP